MLKINSLPSKIARRRHSEQGLSLVELLVAMIIIAIIAAVTVSIVVVLQNTAAKFQTATTTQNQLNIAMNTIQRDISQATQVSVANKYYIGLRTNQNDQIYNTYIFYYNGTGANVPSGANTANLPQSTQTKGAIIEQVFQGTTFKSQTILVGSYQPSSSWNTFFQYYTQNGTQLGSSAAQLTDSQARQVAKVQFSLQSRVSDRQTPIELASAASLNSFVQGSAQCPDTSCNVNPVPISAPVLRGNITYESNTADLNRTAHLSWNQPGNTDSYTIYRTHGSDIIVAASILDPTVLNWDDSNLVYGETYVYYIVANGPSGISASSNTVSLTVRPPKVVIVNINSKAGLNDTYPNGTDTTHVNGARYTVARNLTNQISWAQSNGATGYRIYRNGTQIGTNTGIGSTNFQDTSAPSVYYGQINDYTVQAFNTGQNNSGGPGVTSDKVTLTSPPTAPGIRVYQSSEGDQDTVGTSSTLVVDYNGVNASGNHVYSVAFNQGQAATCNNLADQDNITGYNNRYIGLSDTLRENHPSGTATCYGVKSYNDAGEGPMSTTGSLPPASGNVDDQHSTAYLRPGAFQIININSRANLGDRAGDGNPYTVARGFTNQIAWNHSYNASGFRVYRNGTQIADVDATIHSYQDGSRNYGEVNTYTVVAYTRWGSGAYERRTYAGSTVQLISPPTAPTISGSEYGGSDYSAQPYNTITLTGTVSNANGYKLSRDSSTEVVGNCVNANLTGQEFGVNQGSQINNNVSYGSSSCYKAYAYNDAGDSPESNNVTLFVGPSSFSIVNITSNRDLYGQYSNGLLYTVARDYSNEVAWNSSNGADGYDVYRGNDKIANVSSNSIQDLNRYAGEIETYKVVAYSNWSQNGNYYGARFRDSSNTATLASPPQAPSISGYTNDTNTQSSKSSDVLRIDSTPGGSAASGYSVLSAGTAAGNPNNDGDVGCDNLGYDLGIGLNAGNTATDSDSVYWGGTNCYRVEPSNAAGVGPRSNAVKLKQNPGYFGFNDLSNYTKYLNIYSTYTTTTSCTGVIDNTDYCLPKSNKDPSVNADNEHVDTSPPGAASDRKYANAYVDMRYKYDWSASYGARTDGTQAYDVNYQNVKCDKIRPTNDGGNVANGQGNWNNNTSPDINFAYNNRDRTETHLTPGCYYTVIVTAFAPNGTSRQITHRLITSPTVPAKADNYILTTNNSAFARRVQTEQRAFKYGQTPSASFNGTSNGTSDGTGIEIENETYWSDTYDGNWNSTSYDGSYYNSWNPARKSSDSLRSISYSWVSMAMSENNGSWTYYTTSPTINFTGNVGANSCKPADGQSSCASSWGTEGNPNDKAYYPKNSYTDKYNPGYYSP